ncbi:hypothetical protein E1A91_A09G119900v1 [Gossypium mustelinum]|uniref:Uncharacterized protein n=1 Tax=Gossypium mustelinum TaxID=34275 RepID=A0A5D2XX29_GOSMU|nr:hypothetical protein E1A91_A09G119900v1 [Gossypium mustelinum]
MRGPSLAIAMQLRYRERVHDRGSWTRELGVVCGRADVRGALNVGGCDARGRRELRVFEFGPSVTMLF